MRISVVNPLGAALRHYTDALEDNLRGAGVETRVTHIDEPSVRGGHRLQWLRDYDRALRAGAADSAMSIVTWPTLGMLDFVWARLRIRQPIAVVVHDPRPLVRSVGHGRLSGFMAARTRHTVGIVHSEIAMEDLAKVAAGLSTAMIPHPIIQRDTPGIPRERTIRVLGQYKRTRSLSALQEIARVTPDDYSLEIVGRGWPNVAGWRVRDEFVSESELELLTASAAAVVIPYDRFYQSGIAIRCLETATPFVGRRGSSLDDLLGPEHPMLARDDADWGRALAEAVATSRLAMETVRQTYIDSTKSAFAAFVGEVAREGSKR